jgi:hypothetical protein
VVCVCCVNLYLSPTELWSTSVSLWPQVLNPTYSMIYQDIYICESWKLTIRLGDVVAKHQNASHRVWHVTCLFFEYANHLPKPQNFISWIIHGHIVLVGHLYFADHLIFPPVSCSYGMLSMMNKNHGIRFWLYLCGLNYCVLLWFRFQ